MRTFATIATLSLLFAAAHAEAGKPCGCSKPSTSAPSPTPPSPPPPAPAPAPAPASSGGWKPWGDPQLCAVMPAACGRPADMIEHHLPPPTFPQPDPGPEPEPEPPLEPIVIWSPPYVVTLPVMVPVEVPVERTENVCPVEPVKPKPARRSGTPVKRAGVCK